LPCLGKRGEYKEGNASEPMKGPIRVENYTLRKGRMGEGWELTSRSKGCRGRHKGKLGYMVQSRFFPWDRGGQIYK